MVVIGRRSLLGAIIAVSIAPKILVKEAVAVTIVSPPFIPAPPPPLPNVLNFGNMVWKPELVQSLPIARISLEELVVQPRFKHITSLPILGVMEIQSWEHLESMKSSSNPQPPISESSSSRLLWERLKSFLLSAQVQH